MKCKLVFRIKKQNDEVVAVGETSGMIRKSDLKACGNGEDSER